MPVCAHRFVYPHRSREVASNHDGMIRRGRIRERDVTTEMTARPPAQTIRARRLHVYHVSAVRPCISHRST
jgi:hypothetical protein